VGEGSVSTSRTSASRKGEPSNLTAPRSHSKGKGKGEDKVAAAAAAKQRKEEAARLLAEEEASIKTVKAAPKAGAKKAAAKPAPAAAKIPSFADGLDEPTSFSASGIVSRIGSGRSEGWNADAARFAGRRSGHVEPRRISDGQGRDGRSGVQDRNSSREALQGRCWSFFVDFASSFRCAYVLSLPSV
jgi:hypothetical protein